ncbi:MAG: M23 family metallopeptidase [Cohnella sp.]|nr:M23 family metallopeptidase [Cohnella sp.]
MNLFEGYRITSPFGPRIHPVTHNPHFHTGIDLVKSHKAPIGAFVAGKVVHAGEGKLGTGFGNMGNVVAVKDDRGCLHCYVHLDSVSVKVGQAIERGQEIGKQGSTGKYSTGSHLHYEIRKKSEPSFGWIESEPDRCYEPTQYLIDYYKAKDDEPMTKEEKQVFDAMREDMAAIKLAVEAATKLIPAPPWFVKEFGSADLGGLIHEPRFTEEGWRILAIGLRVNRRTQGFA